MSQAGTFDTTTVLADIETITGDSGPVVGPDGAGNVDILGGSNINTVGSLNTLTINLDDNITITSMATDDTAAGLTISGNDIVVDGTDASIDLTLSGKGPNGGVVITDGVTIGEAVSDRIFTLNGASITSVIAMHSEGVTDLGGFTEERHSDVAAFGAHTIVLRSRGSEGAPAVVQNNDSIGRFIGAGYDGTDFALCAEIAIDVDGVPGADDMPGRIEFLTSQSGTQTPVLAMTIDSSQEVTLVNPLAVGSGGTGAATLTDHGVLVGSGTAAVSVTGTGSAGQVLTSNGGGADPTFQDSAVGGVAWSVETGATKAMVVNEAYFSDRTGATLAFTLPATAAVGETMEIAQMEAGQLWTLAQNVGQTCYIGTSSTTTGVGGSLAATADGDWIEIVCRVADTDFQVNVKSGNITVV